MVFDKKLDEYPPPSTNPGQYVDYAVLNFKDMVVRDSMADERKQEYLEFVDGVREGDGALIIDCWRFLLLQFKASERTKYSIEASTLLAQHDVATHVEQTYKNLQGTCKMCMALARYYVEPTCKKEILQETTYNYFNKYLSCKKSKITFVKEKSRKKPLVIILHLARKARLHLCKRNLARNHL